ncbi:MAG: hypothetical protein ACXVAT_16280, partial [Isosphaeraceae bacterium]
SLSFTIHLPGLQSSVHSRIPLPGKKKDDENAAGRIPGISIPAIRWGQKPWNRPSGDEAATAQSWMACAFVCRPHGAVFQIQRQTQ